MSQRNLNAKNLIILMFAFGVSLTVFSFNAAASECDNWQELHPEWIFCDDFEDETALVREGRYYSYNQGGGDDFLLMNGVGTNGSKGMRALWSVDEVSAGSINLGFGRVPHSRWDQGIRNTEDFGHLLQNVRQDGGRLDGRQLWQTIESDRFHEW